MPEGDGGNYQPKPAPRTALRARLQDAAAHLWTGSGVSCAGPFTLNNMIQTYMEARTGKRRTDMQFKKGAEVVSQEGDEMERSTAWLWIR
jgi:hypothetical protein